MRAALLLAVIAAPATAQPLTCLLPDRIETPRYDGPDARQPVRNVPTTSYTLALSWSPQHCRERRGERSFQCGSANRFGFVLHGLWPDGQARAWPQYCRPVPLLSERVLREYLCATPSVQLLQHEWAKHGSCMSATGREYFDQARGLYQRLRFPVLRDGTVGAFKTAFARANRIPRNAIRVTVADGP